MDDRTERWLESRYWPEDDLLRRLREDLEATGPTIQIAPAAGSLLATLVRATGARRVLEVGTLYGYSAVWIARALPDGGSLDTLELNGMHADRAEHWLREARLDDRVTVHRGAALELLASMRGPFDLVFLDAHKPEYPQYAEHALRLLRPGGLLAADNMIWSGAVADPDQESPQLEGLRGLHAMISGGPGLHSTVLEVGDGLSLTVKE